jgi:hypothetical protein
VVEGGAHIDYRTSDSYPIGGLRPRGRKVARRVYSFGSLMHGSLDQMRLVCGQLGMHRQRKPSGQRWYTWDAAGDNHPSVAIRSQILCWDVHIGRLTVRVNGKQRFVFDVMAASSFPGSILPVSRSTSTNRMVLPACVMASVVAAKVCGLVITSIPWSKATCKQAELTGRSSLS